MKCFPRTLLVVAFLVSPAFAASPTDVVQPHSLPSLGKWMIDAGGDVAHWLNYRVEGRRIDEPINVLLRVTAPDALTARRRLAAALEIAGFVERRGHSNGYRAILDGALRAQAGATFSNHVYLMPNDHVRFFGPVAWENRFVFAGSASREGVALWRKILNRKTLLHPYVSFASARNRLATDLRDRAHATVTAYVALENLVGDSTDTTGDHDGSAVLIDLAPYSL
jgi:hypothetical protein